MVECTKSSCTVNVPTSLVAHPNVFLLLTLSLRTRLAIKTLKTPFAEPCLFYLASPTFYLVGVLRYGPDSTLSPQGRPILSRLCSIFLEIDEVLQFWPEVIRQFKVPPNLLCSIFILCFLIYRKFFTKKFMPKKSNLTYNT